ncbi:phosphate propanoyltransferase [Sporomusa acidovorans]|uniref:Phosphate propanoyltransferase n=1 Tax=Sporomusa acidovorans (strain ATCC 49682 / DSM 3132 / Mol) TaxID=1123286 RepID=A0ABZ3J2V7_SPOA4|nr:phosphate propanoyltransferase [Sporomusa acidovorans]OZC20181.1 phosphate propanoyltransferase [Sporomusa acidovorans DSM 3132]SDD42736.1 putative phosphotransacetylase [Sporomusa acidovorans]
MSKPIPVGISARHVHVTREHLDILFGKGYQLTVKKDLSQPGQFASEEQVDLVTEKGAFKKVRILGPERKQTQVEIALTDALKLGIKPPVRDSGDVKGSPGLTIVGPKGEIKLAEGVIAACRHIHMTPADAAEYGVKDKDIVKARCDGERGLIFDNVLIRVSDKFKLECHLDTDEGNAAKIGTGGTIELIK